VHRFFGGSMGLASPQEVGPLTDSFVSKNPSAAIGASKARGVWPRSDVKLSKLWSGVKRWFAADLAPERRQPCAVCIPPGATLILRDIPRSMQREFGVGEAEEVTFVQTTANANTYRDALRFSNQRQILLQALRPGQRMSVVALDLITDETAAERLTV